MLLIHTTCSVLISVRKHDTIGTSGNVPVLSSTHMRTHKNYAENKGFMGPIRPYAPD